MIIQYELGDYVGRTDFFESAALVVTEVKEDGVMVVVKYPSVDYPSGEFFIPNEKIEPTKYTLRTATMVGAISNNSTDVVYS